MIYGATAQGQRLLRTGINMAERQQFASSPVNIIDSIVITEELDTSNVLAEWIAYDPSITIYSNLVATQAVKLFINWSDRNGTVDLNQGDYFTFVVPDIFTYDFIDNVTDVPITNGVGEVVATYSIYDNINNKKEVKITFTDYVENHTNISGDFWMLLFVGNVASTEQKILEFVINDNLVAQGVVTVNPHTGTLTPRNQKVGYSLPTRSAGGYYIFEWIVYVNMGENAVNGFNTLAGFSFEDIIPADSPHILLSDRIRQELGILPTNYQAEIGEYTGADGFPPELRYQRFLYQYNSTGSDIWYNDIDWTTLVNGLTTAGINGGGGLNVSELEVSDKLLSANLGTLTRPTAIRFYTIATVKMTESALGDTEVVGLFKNTFRGSYGEDLNSSLNLFRFEAGGSAQGIFGEYRFSFFKVNETDEVLPGAMFSLFTSENFAAGADRFIFSGDDGVVAFNNLPAGTYYFLESITPNGYIQNSTIYRVVINSQGFEIYYGENFENRLSDTGNKIVNQSEFEIQPTLLILSGRKNLTGIPIVPGMFGYVVKDNEGNIVASGTNNADGSIQFSSIEYDTPGVYTYTVEEVMGYDARIVYDGSIFTVTVTVTNEEQNLVAEAQYPTGGITFNNRFIVAPTLVILQGRKNLTGNILENNMFSFAVKDSGGNTAAIGTSNADGSIQFSSINFDTPGVYTYTVEEVMGRNSRIIYDGSIFTVTVTVTADTSGDLMADVSYPTGGIVYNNSYVITPVSVTLMGTKNLTCGTLENGMFSFIVKNSEGNTVASGTNNAAGSIQFSSIEYTEPGVFTYTVEEVMGTDSSIIYDGSIFTVTVTVTDDGNGNLVAGVTYPIGGIIFNNSLVEKPCQCCTPCCQPCCTSHCKPCCKPHCKP